MTPRRGCSSTAFGYIYTQTVFPNGDFNFVFNTDFNVSGFTGLAGWRFSDASAAGAGGNAS